MGRMKARFPGDTVGYWDPNDTGPDQVARSGATTPTTVAPPAPTAPITGGPTSRAPNTFPDVPPSGGTTVRRTYTPTAGFDTAKLNDPTHTTLKYLFGRSLQDLDLPTTANFGASVGKRTDLVSRLPSIVAYMNSHGDPNAKYLGGDKIQLGDGTTIDAVTSWGNWNFGNYFGGPTNAAASRYPGGTSNPANPLGTNRAIPLTPARPEGMQPFVRPGQPTAEEWVNNVLATLAKPGNAPRGLFDQLVELYRKYQQLQQQGAQPGILRQTEIDINAIVNNALARATGGR